MNKRNGLEGGNRHRWRKDMETDRKIQTAGEIEELIFGKPNSCLFYNIFILRVT